MMLVPEGVGKFDPPAQSEENIETRKKKILYP